jgi:MoaA/NifB/PqqE/SkfB family radical SAM enzyme
MINNKKKAIPYDAWLFWTVTNACNLNCTYCNASNPKKIIKKFYDLGFLNSAKIVTVNLGKLLEQSFQKGLFRVYQETKAKLALNARKAIDISALIRTLDATQKIFKISFTGGEPFLVPNFIDACRAITEKNYITIFSNLTSPDIKTFSDTIDPRNVLEICGSLHIKELERRRLLERYIENFTLLKEKGFNVSAHVVAYPTLIGEIEKYRSYFKEKGIDITFVPFRGRYRWKQYPKSYTEQEIERFGFGASQNSPADIMSCFYRKGRLCNAGYNVGVVFPSGNAQTCFLIGQSIGNVFTDIAFNKNLIKCPFKYCSCPLNIYDPSLFEKACHENK